MLYGEYTVEGTTDTTGTDTTEGKGTTQSNGGTRGSSVLTTSIWLSAALAVRNSLL